MTKPPGASLPELEASINGRLLASRNLLKGGAAGLTAALWNSPLLAQAQAQAQAPIPARPMTLEWGITGAMIALAIFVVCRKSNRT